MEISRSNLRPRVNASPYPRASGMKACFATSVSCILCLAAGVITLLSCPLSSHAEGPNTPDAAMAGAEPSFQRRESVLEKFRAYTGQKNRAALGRMFQQSDPSFSQAPPVLLADGTSSARVTIRIFSRGDQLPVFSVSGGHCKSAHPSNSGAWVLEIVPKSGSLSTSVTVLAGGSMIEYPLTVAPPMRLFDRKKAGASTVDYVVIANELAGGKTAQPRK